MSEIAEKAGSKPRSPSRELLEAYVEGLLHYLAQPNEPALDVARELGRGAMSGGLSLSDMSTIHHESVKRLLVRTPDVVQYKHRDWVDLDAIHDSYELVYSLMTTESTCSTAANFFAASISPFEMNHRECQQAIALLRYKNSKLEEQTSRFSTLVFDETLQLLAAAGLVLDRVRHQPAPAAGGGLDELQSFLVQIGDELAACANEFQPRVLEDLGLGAAIQSISRRFSAVAQFEVVADTAVGPLLPAVSTTLYRAVEESLTNVARHAQASHVRIRLCDESEMVYCSIGDDGIGFDVSEVLSRRSDRGSGLVSVRESLRGVGGTLAVNSTPGRGTEVVMTVRQAGRTTEETCGRSQ